MKIPLSTITFMGKEKEYVTDAITTGWISGTGDYITRFEVEVGSNIERKHVIAVTNGTVALELALRALGVGLGDEVIVPALTFVAPAAAVKSVGATPVLVDVHPGHWTIDPEEVEKAITRRTAAIIAVDLLGHPCDYDTLTHIATRYNIPLIEDAAQAHGAAYKRRPTGSFGIMSTFSFHANKAVTSGEGGCVATDDDQIAAKLRLIMNHGMEKSRPYYHELVGTNHRMTNLTAAVGFGQAQLWEKLTSARREVADAYDELRPAGFMPRPFAVWAQESCWLYTLSHPERAKILSHLREAGIDARAIWTAIPDLPPYYKPGGFPVSRRVAAEAFWLPTWAGIPLETIEQITGELAKCFAKAE